MEDLTVSDQAGWYSVISLHGGGSPEAMKREIWRNYPVVEKLELVEALLERGVLADGRRVSKQPGRCCVSGCTVHDLPGVEAHVETGKHAEATSALETLEPLWAKALAKKIGAVGAGAQPKARPGYLVFNPLGVARRVAVMLPDASADLRPEGGLLAAQLTDEGVAAVVDVRPQLSPSRPPAQQPTAPAPMTAKVAKAAARLPETSAEKNTRNQAHIAYSSRMWPK